MNEIIDLQFYARIREILATARSKAYAAANFAMVEAYWNIGKASLKSKVVKLVPSTGPNC